MLLFHIWFNTFLNKEPLWQQILVVILTEINIGAGNIYSFFQILKIIIPDIKKTILDTRTYFRYMK